MAFRAHKNIEFQSIRNGMWFCSYLKMSFKMFKDGTLSDSFCYWAFPNEETTDIV